MRLLAILLLALSLSATALAQDNTSAGDTGTADGSEADATNGTEDAPAEPAAPAGPLEIVIEAHTTGGSGYFTIEGQTARNPTLRAAPGQEVRITLKGTDEGVHNFCVGPGKCTAYVTAAGETQTLTFTAPETGSLEYYCQPHRSGGMKGTLAVGDAPADDGGAGEEGSISGETVDLSQYDPACAGRVAPAIVTQGIVGSPTLDDYIAGCKPATAGAVADKHVADYVIPLSWLLIGVGTVGVVWVHKYYKP